MKRVLKRIADVCFIAYVAIMTLIMNLVVDFVCFGFRIRTVILSGNVGNECIKMLQECAITYDWFSMMVKEIWQD